MTTSIHNKLQASRKELLDIGLRNNLISFRKTTKSLPIVNGDSRAVFDALCVAEKSLGFAATSKALGSGTGQVSGDDLEASELELIQELSAAASRRLGTELPGDLSGSSATDRKAGQFRLQTALDEERLFLQLLKIRAEAQTFVEEQGVNILFIAAGFLHWYESDSSAEARRAPLVLIPVALVRATANELFKVVYSGDDLIVNQSLAAMLKTDFDIELPLLDTEAELTADDLSQHYAEVALAVKLHTRWRVETDEQVLGFFSFGKFLMFKDLDSQSWPENKLPANHPVMNRLLGEGFGDLTPAYEDDVNVDTVSSPGDVHFVKDADSSQTQAILEVGAGSNLVIQGPPGTGKSQTITNVIAELISQKKTVLFVSEKMAALEVVKRRLDESHLGDAVLELHSQRATKTSVLKELGRALDQGRPLNDKGEQDIENLRHIQENLNSYCVAVSGTVGKSGLPFLDVLGHYMRCKREWPELVPLAFTGMEAWTGNDFLQRKELVRELQLQMEAMGRPDKNPFWGSERTYFTPIEESTASDGLTHSLRHLEALQGGASDLSQRLMLGHPVTLQDIEVVCRAARRAEEAPKLQGVHLSTQDWQLRRDALFSLIAAGRSMTGLRKQFAEQLIDVAWEQDLLPVRQALLTYGKKWWRFLSGDFKRARRSLQQVAKTELPKASDEMLRMVDAVINYQQHRKTYDPLKPLGEALYGAQWQAGRSDWEVLERVTHWVIHLHDDLGKGSIPRGILDFLSGHGNASGLGQAVSAIEGSTTLLREELEKATTAMGVERATVGIELQTTPVVELASRLEALKGNLPALYHVARFNALVARLKKEGLDRFARYAATCEKPEHITVLLDLTWYAGLVQGVYARNPTLQHFDRIQHEHNIKKFRALDLASLRHAQTKLAAQVWSAKPNLNQPGEMAVLRAELNKKRRHLPIRQLIDKAGRAIQQIKPVFMMSPMSIANFLPPGSIEFDVVVFDEASQVKAVDAFGAILRGRQVVVVGDTRQMPPSDFFGREIDIDDEENTTGDIESILSMFKAAGCWERYLRWHYRSRHESLIAVSNAEFYDHKLVIFPSAGSNPYATGIQLDYLPENAYDRGRTRTNKGEAKAVAQAVMEHAIRHPNLSLGVAAFSVAQRDLIGVEVELLRRTTSAAEPFFSAHPNEPFFVKNLENIQGDERDTIFISIGYGRNETGKLAKEFGPLNKEGGHRRLNVLITRAKMAMRVFCNFKADDLDLEANAKHGVRALKNFLKFAETRQLEAVYETGKDVDSPFEAEVLQALRNLDYSVEPQVGTAGYFIDMAVRDPERPGRYLLAIECDGAAYHSSRSARDRDRLRQAVLEGLGWSFHRIWSTDWFRNRQQEIGRVVTAIDAAKTAAGAEQPAVAPSVAVVQHVIQRSEAGVDAPAQFAKPYKAANLDLVVSGQVHLADLTLLAAMIKAVAVVEAPVHIAEVTKRVMDAYGVTRAGARITARIQEAVKYCAQRAQIELRGEFIYGAGQTTFEPRDRSNLSAVDRNIDWVAPEEISAALLESVRLGYSLPKAEAVTSAIGLLGFGRATEKISSVFQMRLAELVSTRGLNEVDGVLTLPV